MKYILLFIILLKFSYWGFSQTDTSYKKKSTRHSINNKGIIYSGGLGFQNIIFGDLNLLYGEYIDESEVYAFDGPTLGIESNFKGIIAPKIGWDCNVMFFCLRFSLISFIERNNVDYRVLPEIGFTSYKYSSSLTYGYVPHLLGSKNDNIGNHRISMRFYFLTGKKKR
jgi:hypothetical protein